jgi:hypothetical protein
MAGQGFTYAVIDDFPHQMVQALAAGAADIHAGPLADRFQTL